MTQETAAIEFATDVQRWLEREGFDLGPSGVDGHPGRATRAAFEEAVISHGFGSALKAPGPPSPAHDPGTLGVDEPNATPGLSNWPSANPGALHAFYGPPGTGQVTVPLPYPMRLAWDPDTQTQRITCHSKVASSLQECLAGILEHYGSLAGVRAARMDLLGGAYNLRKMRGGTNWSLHAYGAAIDLDPLHNGLKTPWPTKATMPEEVIEIFEKRGWTSLARVIGRDAMHFQATNWP